MENSLILLSQLLAWPNVAVALAAGVLSFVVLCVDRPVPPAEESGDSQ
jgi:hypothetical protein